MTTLLHLDASADRPDHSVSRGLTAQFAATWRAARPDTDYQYQDLSADPVPLVGAGYVALGTRVERQGVLALDRVAELAQDLDEQREWVLTRPLVDQVRAADLLLLGVPMYNIPM